MIMTLYVGTWFHLHYQVVSLVESGQKQSEISLSQVWIAVLNCLHVLIHSVILAVVLKYESWVYRTEIFWCYLIICYLRKFCHCTSKTTVLDPVSTPKQKAWQSPCLLPSASRWKTMYGNAWCIKFFWYIIQILG